LAVEVMPLAWLKRTMPARMVARDGEVGAGERGVGGVGQVAAVVPRLGRDLGGGEAGQQAVDLGGAGVRLGHRGRVLSRRRDRGANLDLSW
jgi:hypothetical protein